jgi:cell wall-associated NlpC family hydrolase
VASGKYWSNGLDLEWLGQHRGELDSYQDGPQALRSTADFGSGAGLIAVRFAGGQIGKPYVRGDNGNPGFDCSGLTARV